MQPSRCCSPNTQDQCSGILGSAVQEYPGSYREQIPDLWSRLKERKEPLESERFWETKNGLAHGVSRGTRVLGQGLHPTGSDSLDCSTGQLAACPECAQNATCLSQWPMQEAASSLHNWAPSAPVSLRGGTCASPRLPTQGQTDGETDGETAVSGSMPHTEPGIAGD